MSTNDEKRAFDAMLAEISDSDEDEASSKGISPSYAADSKPYPTSSSQMKGTVVAVSYKGGSMSKEDEEIANFGVQSEIDASQVKAEQISITKRWLTRPFSKSERNAMKCYVDRERGSFGMQTIYRCYLESNDPNQAARFMMAAKKKVANKTSYYLVTVDPNPDDRGSDTVLGKVRGNAVGSRYLITDHGLAPDKTVAPSMLRKEYGVVGFEFDSGGPSRIEAWVPYVNSNGMVTVWQPDSENASMEAKVEEKDFDRMIFLQNKAPKWDEAHGGHVLNFQGRVTESSVKNFQLCCLDSDNPDDIVLQFGRVGKNRFTMDLKFPLSPLQAFSICVACLDGKIADRKGYEYIKRLTGGNGNGSTANIPHEERNEGNSKGGDLMEGSMRGGTNSISGMIREAIPSSQYLKDKINRKFKL